MGTFTNMTQRQDTSWVSSPPAMRPMAPPAAETVVKSPMARTRAGPSANETVRSDRADGAANAAPRPWRARAARSIQLDVGDPAEHGADGEDGDPDEEHPAPAEEVSGSGPQEQEAPEGQDVGVDHPGEPTGGEAEAVLNVGQGHVHDRRVQHDHQLGREDDEEEDARVRQAAADAPTCAFRQIRGLLAASEARGTKGCLGH